MLGPRRLWPGRCRGRGFSFVELLVAIAVLAILAAMIFALLARAREISLRTQCANNLRQLACAFYLYSQDWGGYWPCPGGLVGDRSYWSQTGNGGLQSYVRQRGLRSVWCCPLMNEWRSRYPARTYGMNSLLRTPHDPLYPSCVDFLCGVDAARITEPRETILLYEGLALTTGWENSPLYNYIYRCADWEYVRGVPDRFSYVFDPSRPWHGRTNNYLYCDGHIVARPPDRLVHAELSSYREMREWFVDKAYFERRYAADWSRWVPRGTW